MPCGERLKHKADSESVQVLYSAFFPPNTMRHLFEGSSYLFPHHLTSKYNVMATLCYCFHTYSVVALCPGGTSTSLVQIGIT